MKSLISRGRPSPAMLVSVIALVFALGGVATALPGKKVIDKNDLKKNVVKSKHIKDGGAKYKDIEKGIAVRAYALIEDAEVVESVSRGISDSNIREFGNGICIEDLSFNPKHIQATHRYLGGGDNELRADVLESADFCDGNDAWVHFSPADASTGFYVALYE
jgi:hypothetical protein